MRFPPPLFKLSETRDLTLDNFEKKILKRDTAASDKANIKSQKTRYNNCIKLSRCILQRNTRLESLCCIFSMQEKTYVNCSRDVRMRFLNWERRSLFGVLPSSAYMN